jgi:2-(1,2-epoxy-1,2-dihydrophenyl)acetyl-CoA isomerase
MKAPRFIKELPMAIDLSISDGIAEIVLNRPEKMNAMTLAMFRDLMHALDSAEEAQVRAMIIRGEGPGFCAGRDLAEADPINEDAEEIIGGIINPALRRIAEFPAPTFAAVHGPCLGAGVGIALACDVVYASEDLKIGSPFARIGAVLDSGAHWFFSSRLGSNRALELIYTGRLLSGAEAVAMGLVNQCVPKAELLDKVRTTASAAAKGPTAAFMQSKQIIRQLDEEALGLVEVMNLEAKAQGTASKTEDYKEGITAFQQKRAPKFIGR